MRVVALDFGRARESQIAIKSSSSQHRPGIELSHPLRPKIVVWPSAPKTRQRPVLKAGMTVLGTSKTQSEVASTGLKAVLGLLASNARAHFLEILSWAPYQVNADAYKISRKSPSRTPGTLRPPMEINPTCDLERRGWNSSAGTKTMSGTHNLRHAEWSKGRFPKAGRGRLVVCLYIRCSSREMEL